MYKLGNNPLMLSGVYKDAWELYKSSLLSVLLWSFIIAVIDLLPYRFGFIGFYHRNMAGRLEFSWLGLLLFIALLIIEAFFLAVLIYTMHSVAEKQKINQAAAIRSARKTLIEMYFGLLFYSIAIIIGMFLFLIPSLFIAVLFAMFLPYVVVERQGVYQAFESSTKLVWGHWWQTFLALWAPYVVFYAMRNLLRFIPWHGQWVHLVNAILITLIMPYFYAVLLVQYHNLKVIKSLPEPISPSSRMINS